MVAWYEERLAFVYYRYGWNDMEESKRPQGAVHSAREDPRGCRTWDSIYMYIYHVLITWDIYRAHRWTCIYMVKDGGGKGFPCRGAI